MARSRAVNLTLIVIYKGKVRRTWRTTGFINLNISVRRYFSSFGRTPSSGMKPAQSFIHEAPGVSFIKLAYAQNGAEMCVRHFPRKGCDL